MTKIVVSSDGPSRKLKIGWCFKKCNGMYMCVYLVAIGLRTDWQRCLHIDVAVFQDFVPPPVQPAPVFKLTPQRMELNPGESVDIHLEGCVDT
jgi:hypothetical protein